MGAVIVDSSIVIARLVLAGVFAAAAVGKLGDLDRSRRSLEEFGLDRRAARPLGVLLPLVELAIAAALLPAATSPWAALAAAVLLGIFSLAIVRVLRRGEAPECNCFGSLGSAPVGRRTLIRNALLIAIAAFVAVAGLSGTEASAWAWIGDLDGTGVAVLVLAVAVSMSLAFSWQLFRQNGRLLERVARLEADGTAPAGAGLPIGEPAPDFVLPDLDGRDVVGAEVFAEGRGALLVFTDPDCAHCNPLLPRLGRIQSAGGRPVVVISTGSERDNRAKAEEHGLARLLLQDGFEVAHAYRVYGSPGAVLVDAAGRIASATAEGARAVEALIGSVPVEASPVVRDYAGQVET